MIEDERPRPDDYEPPSVEEVPATDGPADPVVPAQLPDPTREARRSVSTTAPGAHLQWR